MWCFRRQFDVRASSVLSTTSLDEVLDSHLRQGDHITALKYVVVPVEAPVGIEMLAAEAILAQGEYPEHWLRTWHLLGLRDSPTKAGAFLQWLHHTRHAEFILIGLSNGGVYMVDITAGRIPPQEVLVVVPPPPQQDAANATNDTITNSHRVDGEEGVVGLDVTGTIMAAAVEGGSSVEVSFFFPSIRKICTIPVPSDTRVSSLRLWEGSMDWVDIPGEETALYLFMGTEDGAVRLWRIDVMWDQHTPTKAPFMLHSLLQLHHRTTLAQPAHQQEEELSNNIDTATLSPSSGVTTNNNNSTTTGLVAIPGAVRDDISALRTPIKCITLHGDVEGSGGGRDAGRIVVGTSQCMAAWDLAAIPHIPSLPVALSTCVVSTEEISNRIAKRLLAASSGGAAGSGGGAVTLPVEWLVGSNNVKRALAEMENLPSSSSSQGFHPIGCVGDSRLTGQRVYVPGTRASLQAACASIPGATDVKPKHGLVCNGLEVGVVVDVILTVSPDGPSNKQLSILCGVLFPSLKKSVIWPLSCLDAVVPSALIAMKADSIGPVYSVAAMSTTRLVSGGADGSVKVWEWLGGVYSVAQSVTRHTDLVKQVIPVRRPDVFMSSSYDGMVREWHMYDTPQPFLNCQNTTVISTEGNKNSGHSGVGQSVGPMDYFPAFNALFATPLFDARINTYTLLQTQGCELPPTMAYDGERTRPIVVAAQQAGAGGSSSTGMDDTPAAGAINEVLKHIN